MPPFISNEGNYPALDIGRMRHQITIWGRGSQSSPPTYDSSGSLSSRVQIASAWAAIEPARGRDVIKSGQTVTELPLTIGMWYQPGISSSMEVQSGANIYVIQAIENVLEMDVVLVLVCLALGSNQ